MDALGILQIYLHSPSGAVRPRDRAYISVKPLAAVLQYIIDECIYKFISIMDKNPNENRENLIPTKINKQLYSIQQ